MSTAQVRPSPVDDISVLFVDADGTLYSADILHESVARCLVRNPVEMLKVPYWLLKGRAYLKAQVAALADIDFATLPYRQDVIEFLHSEAAKGRTLVLATAAHEKHARAIAEQLGLFHHVLATRDDSNLKGQAKADAIAEYCRSVNQSMRSRPDGGCRRRSALWESRHSWLASDGAGSGRPSRHCARSSGRRTCSSSSLS
jgi:phosphoserine phosphatase